MHAQTGLNSSLDARNFVYFAVHQTIILSFQSNVPRGTNPRPLRTGLNSSLNARNDILRHHSHKQVAHVLRCHRLKKNTSLFPVECPPGYEPKTLEDGTMTCSPCNFGYFKKYSGGSDLFCEKCRKDQWTISTASILMSDCISKSRKKEKHDHLDFDSMSSRKTDINILPFNMSTS